MILDAYGNKGVALRLYLTLYSVCVSSLALLVLGCGSCFEDKFKALFDHSASSCPLLLMWIV